MRGYWGYKRISFVHRLKFWCAVIFILLVAMGLIAMIIDIKMRMIEQKPQLRYSLPLEWRHQT